MPTREAVAFASTIGFSTDRTAKTIPAVVTTKILIFMICDAVTALSQAFKMPTCWGSSA